MIDKDKRLLRNDGVLFQEMKGDLLLLKPDDGKYYAIDKVGARIWDLCDGSHSVGDVASEISEASGAPLATVEVDVIEFLEELAGEKLVAPVE